MNTLKLNYSRIILGGIAGGIGMLIVGMVIHGGVLRDNYIYLQQKGVLVSEDTAEEWKMAVHHFYLIFSGIILALLYALLRLPLGKGIKTAVITGFLVGLISAAGAVAMLAFYNAGNKVPFFTFIDSVIEPIVGCIIAGWLYKD
ncbi:MAG: hypothetical protein KatS3mg028_0923 [Bacteroidia bacterium]|nr:MAG: hypothetical protein KatS3mg028_0923 [Bacteroidia bacterium]